VKNPNETAVVDDLHQILRATQPDIVYLHNLADKHDTHIGVSLRAMAALRAVETKPKKVYGCEVWRDLDWMLDDDKQVLPVSARSNIAAALVGVFDSQVTGGKRYDLATAGRRLAHATYYASHGTDQENALSFAMDLTPLVEDPGLSIADYVVGFVDRFREDVARRLR
jgi:LmbE family N-acetylglucosaminyl deacetylase